MKDDRPQRLLGIVLCGGQSKRMGRDKSCLAHPSGGTFLSYATDRLDPLCDHVCRVGRHATTTDHSTLTDDIPDAGPAAGVSTALRFAVANEFDAALVTPVDMPSLTTEDLRALDEPWRLDHRQLVVAVSGPDRRVQPLVAIYPVHLATTIRSMAQGTDRSLHRWIVSRPHLAIPLSPGACQNINTPEDYQQRGR